MGKHFLWDPVEDNIVKEIDDSGTTIADYTTEPYLYGDLISQHRGGQSSFYHYDGQGSTTSLTDSAANVMDTYAYSAFGEVTAHAGSTVNPFQYVGRKGYYRYAETGEYIVRHRPLSVVSGRWRSRDPLLDSDALHSPYVYAHNSPFVIIDPSGQVCVVCDAWLRNQGEDIDSLDANLNKPIRRGGIDSLIGVPKDTWKRIDERLRAQFADVSTPKFPKLTNYVSPAITLEWTRPTIGTIETIVLAPFAVDFAVCGDTCVVSVYEKVRGWRAVVGGEMIRERLLDFDGWQAIDAVPGTSGNVAISSMKTPTKDGCTKMIAVTDIPFSASSMSKNLVFLFAVEQTVYVSDGSVNVGISSSLTSHFLHGIWTAKAPWKGVYEERFPSETIIAAGNTKDCC